MCIAIAQPAGTRLLSLAMFRQCAKSNDDGLGLAWMDWRQPNPLKRLRILRVSPDSGRNFDVDWFWERYRQIHQHWGAKSPIIIHFRWSTRGNVDQYNCHPFRVNPMTALIHNGVLSMPTHKGHYKNLFEYDEVRSGYSDTWHYAHLYFSRMEQEDLQAPWFIKQTEKFIGSNNKLVFLDTTDYTPAQRKLGYDNLIIYNESQGVWDGKVWFSNTGYKTYSNCNTQYSGRRTCFDDTYTYGWPCETSGCNRRVYFQEDKLCYDCLHAAKRVDAAIQKQLEESSPEQSVVAASTVAAANSKLFDDVQYDKDKGQHSDTQYYPPLVMKSQSDPRTNGEGGILCAAAGCEKVIPHRNQHYCEEHLAIKIQQNKLDKAKHKQQVQEAHSNGNSK